MTASYLIWKGQGQTLDLEGLIPGRDPVVLTPERFRPFYFELRKSVQERGLSAVEKDRLAEEIARRLGQDYDYIKQSRLFHLMNVSEVAEIAKAGVSIQLHTHRHRTPKERTSFEREVDDNCREIVNITGIPPKHFCYPSGDFEEKYFDWLRARGVGSATTCELGLASPGQNWLRLPRLLDTEPMSDIEFDAWLSGFGSLLPSTLPTFKPTSARGLHLPSSV